MRKAAEPLSVPLRSTTGIWTLAATILGSGMAFLDSTAVNVALPAIQSNLAAPLSGLQWIVDAYALLLASLLLVGGSLGDRLGRKRVYIAGLALFTFASLACALAPNLIILIAARAIQGVGAALLVPASLAIIKAVIAPHDSGRAIGLWAGLSGVTSAIGPLLGGYLIGALSWRAIFFLNVPLAAAAIFVTARFMPDNSDPRAERLDLPGAVATIAGLGGLTYGLIEGPDRGWMALPVVATLAIGVLGLAVFPLIESRVRHPMIPLHLFTLRDFSFSNLVTLGVYFCFGGALLFLVLDLQQIQGYTPLQAGAALLPITLLLLILSPIVGSMQARVGPRLPMTVGPVIIAAGFLLVLRTGRHIDYPTELLPPVLTMGLGMGIFVTPLTTTVMSSVPQWAVGVASGVNNAVARAAGLLAVAVLGALVASRFDATLPGYLARAHVPAAVQAAIISQRGQLANIHIPATAKETAAHVAIQDAFLDGFHWAMATCAAILLLCALLSAVAIRPLDSGH